MLNFRLTEEEFERLQAACLRNGARCLSDYARTTVLNQAAEETSAATESITAHFGRLERKIDSFERAAERLLGLLPPVGASLKPRVEER
jgi:hypothetical protein